MMKGATRLRSSFPDFPNDSVIKMLDKYTRKEFGNYFYSLMYILS
jgi:hypothetical protein